tara:strand:- start:438 stop:719 length:282 start_codon:yes stop_codon:yes gene_type:complete
MQIKSADGAMTVDYYECKNWNGVVSNKVRLRILTFVNETVNKKLIHVNDMAVELMDRIDNYGYEVKINTKRPAQFVPQEELSIITDTVRSLPL